MRLIRLSAFEMRLKSDILEWPVWPQVIRLPISSWIGHHYNLGKASELTGAVTQHIGLFRATNRFEKSGEHSVQLYEMCEII